jgi:succinate dehydrogenase hydrophobic anchor subunit
MDGRRWDIHAFVAWMMCGVCMVPFGVVIVYMFNDICEEMAVHGVWVNKWKL